MDRYVVIGNPVSHSLSPHIHAAFARATHQSIEYDRMLVPPGGFAEHARRFFGEGGRGANVTLPFKVDAFELAQASSERARVAGAANFLAMRDGFIFADNTDGAGLVTDLESNHHVVLQGATILVLGAGGAARGILAPILDAKPARVVIANRTAARALELAARFRSRGSVEGVALEAIPVAPYDLVFNATSTSTHGEALALPRHVAAPRAFAYDLAYGAGAVPFVERMRAAGMRAADGLGMLVEQAAESFFLWRGVRPQTAPVLAELRARLA